MYEVGLGDSPMRIARKLAGDARRYSELLAANPHKSVVHVGGQPTFATLGVGEPLFLPLGFLGASYADELAAVGLHPDNPDAMFANLMNYIHDPVKFKNADNNWPGAKDDKIWWDDGSGKIALQWPFMGGKWLDAAPIGWPDAKLRAVFKIPAGTGTKDYLAKLYRVTGADAKKPFYLQSHTLTHGGGFNIDVGGALNTVANAVSTVVPGLLPGSSALAALVTGKDPIEALKKDINNFTEDGALAKAVSSGDWSGAGNIISNKANKLGIQLPPAAVQAAVAVAKNGGDPKAIAASALGDGYKAAWNAATNYGQILTDLQPPAGLSYKPGAAPLPTGAAHPVTAQVESHPAVAPARKVIALKLGAAPAPAATPNATPAATPATSAATPAAAPVAPAPSPAAAPSAVYPPYAKTGVSGAMDPLYYLFMVLPGMGVWAPTGAGQWQSTAQVQQDIAKLFASDPTVQFGAFRWDGQNIAWQILSPYR